MTHGQIIYFVTTNRLKKRELQKLWTSSKYQLGMYNYKISEIQSSSIQTIAIDKAREAYKVLFRPVLVEHSGLLLTDYGNLPGGLTQIVWDSLTGGTNAQKFSELFAPNGSTPAIAQTVLAYCDGKRTYPFIGEIQGKIVNPPRGNKNDYWDCVFQPNDDIQGRTFAEMGNDTKNDFSMRAQAMKLFMDYLNFNSNFSEEHYYE